MRTPLPPRKYKKPPTGRFLHFRTDAVRFEGLGLQAQPSPNRPTAAAARQLRAPKARVPHHYQISQIRIEDKVYCYLVRVSMSAQTDSLRPHFISASVA